jgi:chromosome segregation ATPase
MIQKEAVDRLIAELQELLAGYDEITVFEAKLSRTKADYDKLQREFSSLQQQHSELERQYRNRQQQLAQLSSDVDRRSAALHQINSEIQTARQRAFGGEP